MSDSRPDEDDIATDRLFVGGLSYEATEEDLEDLFSRAGEVVSATIKVDRGTGRPRGFAFVQMATDKEAEAAIRMFHGADLLGREIRVQLARRRSTTANINVLEGEAQERRSWALLAGAALVAGVLSVAVAWFLLRPTPADSNLLMVGSFDVRAESGAAQANYVGYAVAQGVAVNLARGEEIQIIAPTQEVLGDDQLREAAVEEGAGRLLRGTITRSGDQDVVSVTLIDPGANRILWGSQIQARGSEVVHLGHQIASDVAPVLGIRLPRVYDYVTNLNAGPGVEQSELYDSVLRMLRTGEIRQAASATSRLVRSFPRAFVPAVWRAHVLYETWEASPQAGTFEALDQSLAHLDGVDSENPYGNVYRARLLALQERPAEAIQRLTQVLERDDLAPAARGWVLRFRGEAKLGIGDEVGALEDFVAGLAADPSDVTTLILLSDLRTRRGEHDVAEARARDAVSLAPKHPRALAQLGFAEIGAGRFKEAAAPLSISCKQEASSDGCAALALAWAKDGRGETAQNAVALATKAKPTARGHYYLGRYYAVAGEKERATEALTHAVEAGFTDPAATTHEELAELADVAKRLQPKK